MEDSIHREILEEHARSPKLKGILQDADLQGTWVSLKTGNECTVYCKIENNIIDDIRFSAQGSALSDACSSIMCCEVKGMNILDAQSLAKKVIEFVEKDKEFSLIGDLVCIKQSFAFLKGMIAAFYLGEGWLGVFKKSFDNSLSFLCHIHSKIQIRN